MRSRFVEAQIIGIWKEQESGQKTANVRRKIRILAPSFHRKNKTLQISEVRRLKNLEDENVKLKKMLAEATLARRS